MSSQNVAVVQPKGGAGKTTTTVLLAQSLAHRDVKVAVVMAVFFFAGSYFGAKFATQLPQVTLRKIFAVMLLIIAVKTWLQK